jgi:type II secretory pathway pseudopilin PulG
MFTALKRRNRPRRGVTLVEMLVVVALVVLMMVILVQIFQSALGAMSASRTNQELDVQLRAIDSMIRSDLAGVTAKMTPPNDPALKRGYFEYGENAPADAQGEDTDDFIAFTTLAPEGQSFTGRQWLSKVATIGGTNVQTINQAIQPAPITSQAAEVIYFWRNGNLYRRVFLVAPNRSTSIATTGTIGSNFNPAGGLPPQAIGGFNISMFGTSYLASWLGLNEISARPGGFNGTGNNLPPIPNDLGDLTNRENRAFRPRFMNDFNPKDGIPDDNNADGLPDYYPTLYYNGANGHSYVDGNGIPIWSPNFATKELVGYPPAGPARVDQGTAGSYDVYAFPFIYPGMYSQPDPNRLSLSVSLGWIHYQPSSSTGFVNHAPLDIGDTPALALASTQTQTWWGFPTWRETMSGFIGGTGGRNGWTDPVFFVSENISGGVHQQPLGLRPFPPTANPATTIPTNLLPPIYQPGTANPPPFFDGAGSASFVSVPTAAGSLQSVYPNPIWEDDLILTNVRSFDVKAFDPAAALYNTAANGLFSSGYLDLGYGSASYLAGPNGANPAAQTAVPFQAVGADPQGFGHEGRIPPLLGDFRPDPRRGFNIGDPSTGIIRLTRTWDSWSTAYTNAPTTDILLNGNAFSSNPNPIYPAFPPPYPSALRGIQIQIRITDPRNERTKVLTIRHDFTDKI